MIHAGDIFEAVDGQRVVVYRAQSRDFPAIFYESLPFDGSSGAFCGRGSEQRFLACYPTWIDRMRFEGAHQLYRSERTRREQIEGASLRVGQAVTARVRPIRPLETSKALLDGARPMRGAEQHG